MDLESTPGRVTNIFQEQLRRYMRRHHEGEYVLIDVREPREYDTGHIPGAKLMPLSDFDVRVAELAKLEEKDLIFYCRSGARSARVSEYAAVTIGFPHVFNLLGGYSAWSGLVLTQAPRLKTIHLTHNLRHLIEQALELEKGAHRMYAHLLDHFKDTAAAPVIDELARAEVGHARAIYDLFRQWLLDSDQDFQALFDGLRGDLLESGESFEEVIERAKATGAGGSLDLLEMALQIELAAYDLYKNLSDEAPDEAAHQVWAELAQHEKRHAHSLLKKIEQMAASRGAA
jgi:rhodanese-related sulfurtransferase/rubrerythrin